MTTPTHYGPMMANSRTFSVRLRHRDRTKMERALQITGLSGNAALKIAALNWAEKVVADEQQKERA